MNAWRMIRSLNPQQRNTFLASFLGWSLDAFDFFLLTFVTQRVAAEFHVGLPAIALALTLTLVFRPLGALIFGILAERYGRRVPLMIDILFYSVMELLTAFSPNYTVFIILRVLFGVGMGGEWGLGPPWPWRRCRPSRAASSRGSCNKATPLAICSGPLSSSASSMSLA